MNSRLVIIIRLFTNRLPVTSCRSHFAFHVILIVIFSALCGCAPKPMVPYSPETPPLILLQYFPDAECDSGDEGALESLRPEIRKRWLATHSLPESIRYYSIITYPDADDISSTLTSSYPGRHQGVCRFNGYGLPVAERVWNIYRG
jgi:hypothetical protein